MPKNLISGPILVRLAQICPPPPHPKKLLSKLNINGKKISFGPDLGPLDQNSGSQFFFKNLALSVPRYHGQLSSCRLSEKASDSVLRKLGDGRTDRQTDESDFIGRCLTNVERPKSIQQCPSWCFLMKPFVIKSWVTVKKETWFNISR